MSDSLHYQINEPWQVGEVVEVNGEKFKSQHPIFKQMDGSHYPATIVKTSPSHVTLKFSFVEGRFKTSWDWVTMPRPADLPGTVFTEGEQVDVRYPHPYDTKATIWWRGWIDSRRPTTKKERKRTSARYLYTVRWEVDYDNTPTTADLDPHLMRRVQLESDQQQPNQQQPDQQQQDMSDDIDGIDDQQQQDMWDDIHDRASPPPPRPQQKRKRTSEQKPRVLFPDDQAYHQSAPTTDMTGTIPPFFKRRLTTAHLALKDAVARLVSAHKDVQRADSDLQEIFQSLRAHK